MCLFFNSFLGLFTIYAIYKLCVWGLFYFEMFRNDQSGNPAAPSRKEVSQLGDCEISFSGAKLKRFALSLDLQPRSAGSGEGFIGGLTGDCDEGHVAQ